MNSLLFLQIDIQYLCVVTHAQVMLSVRAFYRQKYDLITMLSSRIGRISTIE